MPAPKRILVIRLDRIGDVVLSTPVLQALRQAYPGAFIAMMVRPECRELIDGNPHVNQVLVYDKDGRHRGVLATWRFARSLRASRFDTALALHPTNRTHWIMRLAGIPVRIGYDRKSAWLLTRRLAHRKQEGARHEADYTLDLVRALGIEPPAPQPHVPINPELDRRVARVLEEHGLAAGELLVALHPSASGLSKRWKPERFAQVADRLIGSHCARIVLVAGNGHTPHARAVAQAMRGRPIDFSGRLSVGELACLLRRCRLLISNDSGPVHVAAAVGTPVVDLFGRSQPGLNPERWRALGEGHIILSKTVPQEAPAHGDYESAALEALTVDEVYAAAASILGRSR